MPRFNFSHTFRVAPALFLSLVFGALSACGSKNNVVDGQKYTVRTVVDQQQRLPFVALMAPEGWNVTGEVRWKYEDVSQPVTAFIQVTNPNKPESVTFFPMTPCYWLQGAAAYNRPGSKALGQLNVYPMRPPEALRQAILKIYRSNIPNIQIVGSRDLPGLANILHEDGNTKRGIGMKIQYEENGVAMDEEFYALYYNVPIPYDGPQGHSVQIDWGLDRVHSFKAPRGTFDQHRDAFAFVVHSIQTNPAWMQRALGIRKFIGDQFNRNLAQGYANIEAAGRLSRQISANSDAMIASIDNQRAAANASGSSGAEGRSSNDRFDDYVRGVDTTNDPYTGTSQHSSSEQYHWTDGYGNYANSNEANFDPNNNSNIGWQQMTPAQ